MSFKKVKIRMTKKLQINNVNICHFQVSLRLSQKKDNLSSTNQLTS